MPSFIEIGPPVLEKKIFEGFLWAWRPSWSCDLDFLYTHWFPLPIDASYKIWLSLAKRIQRRRSLKLWTDGRRTTDRTPDHGHPISSPCEPNGSGELIIKQGRNRTNNSTTVHLTFCLMILMCFGLSKTFFRINNQIYYIAINIK